MATSSLTAKREIFCQRYVAGGDATKAAREAKYSERSAKQMGHDLLQEPAVAARIAELQAAATERNDADADYVLTNAKEIVERCMERAPVMVRKQHGPGMEQKVDADGNHVWQFDSRGALGGLTLIAKLGGMFPDKPQLQVNADLDKLSDAQLEHLAHGGSLADLPR